MPFGVTFFLLGEYCKGINELKHWQAGKVKAWAANFNVFLQLVMAKHNELGKLGENLAAIFLQDIGMELLARNWTRGRVEVDLLARDGSSIVFIEVKTRRRNLFGYPEAAVGMKKLDSMIRAAGIYINETGHEGEVRLDIVSVTMEPSLEVRHFKDVYFPML